MKQDGCNGKTESQAAATLCKKKVRCVFLKDHISWAPWQARPAPGSHSCTWQPHLYAKGKGDTACSMGETGRKAIAVQWTSPLRLYPMWTSLFCPCFYPPSALAVRENSQSLVVLKFNYPLTGVILGKCCYTCGLTVPVITLKNKGLHVSVLSFIKALFLSA